MSHINASHLSIVEARAQLELCLDMMEEIQQYMYYEHYGIAQALTCQMLETFGREFREPAEEDSEPTTATNNCTVKLTQH